MFAIALVLIVYLMGKYGAWSVFKILAKGTLSLMLVFVLTILTLLLAMKGCAAILGF